MKLDLPSVAAKVAKFLGKSLPSSPQGMNAFMEHLSFDKMKTNKAVNKDDFMTVLDLIYHISRVLLLRQILKRQLSRQMFVRKLLIFSAMFLLSNLKSISNKCFQDILMSKFWGGNYF